LAPARRHRASSVFLDREALEREAADGLALHEAGIAGRSGITVRDNDCHIDVHRIEELVEATRRAGFLGDDDGAPGGSPHGVTGGEAGHDGRRVAVCGFRQIYALHGGVRRFFVAHEEVFGVVVVWPESDLVGGRRDAARHERNVQARGHLDGLHVVGSIVGAERALLERMADAEQLLGVLAQQVGDERAEVAVGMVRDHPGRHTDHGQAGDENPGDE
jgi:hypothetical protein